MKRLFWLLLVLLLVTILFFEYKNYKRHNPPNSFDYSVNDSIDLGYYDPIAVQQYYENAYQIGSFARQLWFNQGIDINFPDETNTETRNALNYYRTLVATTNILEKKLFESRKLKNKGFNNDNIRRIIEEGVSPEAIRYEQKVKAAGHLINLKIGDFGQDVWELQKILITMGYDIPKDGSFGFETQNAIVDFQKRKDLYPSGIVNVATIEELVK